MSEATTANTLNIQPRSIEQAATELAITWSDGRACHYAAASLRRACPCAQCVNEWTGERLLKAETIADSVVIEDAQLVGRYALTVRFSDKHETGIYSFRYLRELCAN